MCLSLALALLCGSMISVAKFSLLVIQAPNRMALGEKDYERPLEEGCPQKGQLSLALPWKSPCEPLSIKLHIYKNFLLFPEHSLYFTPWLCQPIPSNQTTILISTCPDLAILQGQIENVSSSTSSSSLSLPTLSWEWPSLFCGCL